MNINYHDDNGIHQIRRLNRGLSLLSSSIPPYIDRLRIRSGVDSIAPVRPGRYFSVFIIITVV